MSANFRARHLTVARPFALSCMDGRYRQQTARLAALLCEESLTIHRLYIEVCWLLKLGQTGMPAFAPLKENEAKSSLTQERDRLLKLIKTSSNKSSAKEIQAIFSEVKKKEQQTRHDVKAAERWLLDRLRDLQLPQLRPFAHFACTSADINSTSWGMMLQAALSDIVLPTAQQLCNQLAKLAKKHDAMTMLARTHGQVATPTTFGKETAVFARRLQAQLKQLEALKPSAKFSGATGNFSAHSFAEPDADWPAICLTFVRSLKLDFNEYTTQIEPGDRLAEICHCLMRICRILTDLSRDFWGYIALNYLQQKKVYGEIGSSTMPHKINPIDFENAEGNLSMAHVLLERLAADLTVSRWQRDLSGSTQMRNLGQALGHFQVAAASLLQGLKRITPNKKAMKADLKDNWQVLTEAVQTLLRLAGTDSACELIIQLTRREKMTANAFRELITNALDGRLEGLEKIPNDILDTLPEALAQLSEEQRDRLRNLKHETYLGLAKHLAGPSWEFYKGDAGEWRWIRTPINGKTVEESKEGYKNLADCHADAVQNGYDGPKPNESSGDKGS